MSNTFKLLLMILLLGASRAGAQNNTDSPGASPRDSLMKYMRIAGENNPLVMQRLNEYRASLEKVRQVGSLPDPELTTGIFLSPMELIGGNQVAELSLMQMFPWFGVLKNSKDEMSLMAQANYESFRDARAELYYNVERSWYQFYVLKEEINIAEKNMELLRTIERLALTRFRQSPGTRSPGQSSGTQNSVQSSGNFISQGGSGNTGSASGGMGTMGSSSGSVGSGQSSGNSMGNSMGISMPASSGGSLSDLYRIQMEIADLENKIAMLKNRTSPIQAQFNALLNRPLDVPVHLPDTLTADTLNVALEAITDSMLTNNHMLAMIDYERQSIESQRLMNLKMGYPMIGVGLNYSIINESMMSTSEMNGNDMIMPMVKVTLPIYRKKYKSLQKEAILLKTVSDNNYQATANTLKAEIYQAVQSYLDARLLMELYRNQHTLAQKSLDLMIRDFSVSGASLTDILRVMQQTLDYEFKQVEALADYNTSMAYIRRLMSNNGAQ